MNGNTGNNLQLEGENVGFGEKIVENRSICRWQTLTGVQSRGGGGVTPNDGLYGEAPSERGLFFRLQVYERVGLSLVEVYKRGGKSVIWVCERALKG